jgi:hypothetical protein
VLDTNIALWIKYKLPRKALQNVTTFLQTVMSRTGIQAVLLGTLFSGCDLAKFVMMSVLNGMKAVTMVPGLRMRYSSDNNADCKHWIMKYVQPELFFTDTTQISTGWGLDEVSGKRVPVPRNEDFLAIGFVCTSKSALNRKRKLHAACVQNRSDATGLSFEASRAHIDKTAPKRFALENLDWGGLCLGACCNTPCKQLMQYGIMKLPQSSCL